MIYEFKWDTLIMIINFNRLLTKREKFTNSIQICLKISKSDRKISESWKYFIEPRA